MVVGREVDEREVDVLSCSVVEVARGVTGKTSTSTQPRGCSAAPLGLLVSICSVMLVEFGVPGAEIEKKITIYFTCLDQDHRSQKKNTSVRT